jgi:dihydrofolate reductase
VAAPSSAPVREITLIAALGRNRVIGRADGSLPWRLPDDLAHFKRETLGKPIVQGRKTYDTVGKPLPNRLNIVLSRNPKPIEGCVVVSDVDAALAAAGDVPEVMIIGGAQIYELFLPIATRMTLTHVAASPEGEAHFPIWDPMVWRITGGTHHGVDDKHAFAFDIVRYDRAR